VDITGKQIYTRNDIRCIAGDNVISFSDLSFLKQGIYILKLCNLDGPALFETKIIQRID